MKLGELIEGLEIVELVNVDDALEINAITSDSTQVREGDLFIARRGLRTDGHLFIKDAISRGAVCIIYDKPADITENVARVRVRDSLEALPIVSARFYSNPAEKLRVVGVTGTNGKTSTVLLIAQALREANKKPAVIGTLGVSYPPKRISKSYEFMERGLTSPEPILLHRIFRDAVEKSCDYAIMEASSHAIALKRLNNIPFAVKLFTNLTQDHLDFHGTMEEYFRVKKSFFEREEFGRSDYAVICVDNDEGKRIFEELDVTGIPYGFSRESAVYGNIIGTSLEGTRIEVTYDPSNVKVREFHPPKEKSTMEVATSLVGRHNVPNILGAFAVALMEGVSPESIALAIPRLKNVPGRLERVENKRGIHVFVDYAHTPDALKQVLSSLREVARDSRIICVFGCGGDRDPTKRPLMAQSAARFSDALVITTDNPRSEDPADIAADITSGLRDVTLPHSPKFIVELDRKTAIAMAIHEAELGEVVLIAGKGHEDYQVFRDRTIHFSDVEVAKAILEGE